MLSESSPNASEYENDDKSTNSYMDAAKVAVH